MCEVNNNEVIYTIIYNQALFFIRNPLVLYFYLTPEKEFRFQKKVKPLIINDNIQNI